MSIPYAIVDAFTSEIFGGNPAAVVQLRKPRNAEWMQAVAAEFALSETAFVELGTDTAELRLRWFTPTSEVDLCGHATLATTHVLGGSRRFATNSGPLVCTADDEGWIEMDFPADPPVAYPTLPPTVLQLRGVTPVAAALGADCVIEVSSAAELAAYVPDFDALASIDGRGVILTAQREDDDEVDFVSRCFYPKVGLPEDPVTGSAHCTLVCWWAERTGRTELVGRQLSKRGGTVGLALHGDRVAIRGRAVTVAEGVLLN